MRQAARRKFTARQQIAHTASIPAPIGGWNARDALAAMDKTDAVALDNFFPRTSYVEGRGGYTQHVTGIPNPVKTLAVYTPLSGSRKLFGFTAAYVYNVTSAGAVGASVATRTNGKHQYVNFGDGSSNWLIAVNGVDKPLYYDGTTWTAVDNGTSPALTGLTSTSIDNVFVFKGRLIFIEKTSLSFWYLAAGAAGGALTEFPLDGEAVRGGYLVAGSTWTLDGGDGIDDYAVFITSEGEVIVYRGTNPSSAATWAKIGTYYVGRPLGKRCVVKYGGDLMILTENGVFPLSSALPFASVDSKLAVSFKIENAFNVAARSYFSKFGWEGVIYPQQSAFIVNVPVAEDGEHQQYVMNTITKAWCRFTGWNAETFAVMGGDLYFALSDGSDSLVAQAWSGSSDDTSNITLYGKQAFSYFGQPGKQKLFTLFRPVLVANGSLTFLADVDVDFQDEALRGSVSYSVTAGAVWDASYWDVDYFAGSLKVLKEWIAPEEYTGYAGAGKIQIETSALTIQWVSSDYVYTIGGVL